MFNKSTVIFSLFALSMTVLACQTTASVDDDPQTNENKIANIDGTTTMSAFTDEENDAFCVHLDESIDKLINDDAVKEGSCLMGAASMAVFGGETEEEQIAACEESFTECIEMEEDDSDEFSMANNCFTEEDRADCNATVRELDACFSATLNAHVDVMKNLASHDCEALVTSDIMDEFMEKIVHEDDVEECQVLEEKGCGFI